MIKLEKDFLNKSKKLIYKCENCGHEGSYDLCAPEQLVGPELFGINIDDNCEPLNEEDLEGFECSECHTSLKK